MRLDFRLLTALLVLVLLLVGFVMPARAQTTSPCGPVQATLHMLQSQWSERPLWTGHLPDGCRLVLVTTADGGSWTVLIVQADGIACGAAAGTGWHPGGPPAPGIGG